MKGAHTLLKISGILFPLIFFLCQAGCAGRGRPGGGPLDKTPPFITGTNPQPDSTGVRDLKEISIYFSERMNESSVNTSIFASPPLKFKTDWSGGDELILAFEDSLKSDQTYVITIGSGGMDMQKNRLADSFQFAFSTGDSINRGEIYGKIFNVDKKDIFYIYAYKIINPDSLNPATVKADYLSQPGPDGSYALKYLPAGDFRVFVIEDRNKNLLLDGASERIGIPTRDISLIRKSAAAGPLNFTVTSIDTVAPGISGVRALNNRTIQLRINEVVDNIGQFTVVDTLKNDTLLILGISPDKEERKYFNIFTFPQDSGAGYRLSVPQLIDSSGNVQNEMQSANFVGNARKDTTKFELVDLSPADSSKNVEMSTSITVEFSLPVNLIAFIGSFNCMDADSATIAGNWQWKNQTNGTFYPDSPFLPGNIYKFSLSTARLTSLWGDTLADTTYYRTLFMRAEDEFGSVTGEFVTKSKINTGVYVNLNPLQKRKEVYQVPVNENNRFYFQWITEGKYKLGGFVDDDKNGRYSPGKLFPFQYSEPFVITDDTLRVRKRWELSDIPFTIPGVE